MRQSVRDRLRSLDENHGKEGGKCQSSSRGWMGSGSEDLESEGGYSGEFRPLSRPERTRWRRLCASRGPGDRRRRRRRGCGGRLAALVLDSLAAAGGFPHPERGGKCQFSPTRKGGKVPVQPHPERGGKCHLWRWRRSAGDFEVVLSGGSSALRSWTDRGRRSWRPPGSIRPSGGCSDGRQGWIKYIMQSFLEGRIHSRRERRRDLGERRLILSPATVGSRRDPLPAESPSYRTGDPSAAV